MHESGEVLCNNHFRNEQVTQEWEVLPQREEKGMATCL